MGRPKKMSVSDLRQSTGALTPSKTVTEVVATQLEKTKEGIKSAKSDVTSEYHPLSIQPPVELAEKKTTEIKAVEEKAYVTHGALTPDQTRNISKLLGKFFKNSYDAFATLEDYSKYINNLTLSQLHQHALEFAKVVPVQDRSRLIKSLENEYGVHSNRAIHKVSQPSQLSEEAAKNIETLIRKKLGR